MSDVQQADPCPDCAEDTELDRFMGGVMDLSAGLSSEQLTFALSFLLASWIVTDADGSFEDVVRGRNDAFMAIDDTITQMIRDGLLAPADNAGESDGQVKH